MEQLIELIEHSYLKSVKFTQERQHGYETDNMYSWIAKSEQRVGCIFPMRNSEYVKFFKTLKGAKRNFIRRYLK